MRYEESAHLVALGPVRDLGTDFLNDARGVRARDEGVVLDEEAEILDLPVDGVQGGGDDLDEKLLGAGLRDGDLGDLPLALLHGEDKSFLGSHGEDEEQEVVESREVGENGRIDAGVSTPSPAVYVGHRKDLS